MERPVIYVKRITNLSDARYCAGMGADLLGFVGSPGHEDYVTPQQFGEIMGWVSGPKRVVELTDWPKDGIENIITAYHPDLIHLSGNAASRKAFPQFPLILEPVGQQVSDITVANAKIEFVVVAPGTATAREQQLNLLIDLGKDAESISGLLQAGVSGFMLQGSRELKPGLKDYDHLSRILEALDF